MAPQYCLQYFTLPTGILKSFNYDDAATVIQTRQASYLVSLTFGKKKSISRFLILENRITHLFDDSFFSDFNILLNWLQSNENGSLFLKLRFNCCYFKRKT